MEANILVERMKLFMNYYNLDWRLKVTLGEIFQPQEFPLLLKEEGD